MRLEPGAEQRLELPPAQHPLSRVGEQGFRGELWPLDQLRQSHCRVAREARDERHVSIGAGHHVGRVGENDAGVVAAAHGTRRDVHRQAVVVVDGQRLESRHVHVAVSRALAAVGERRQRRGEGHGACCIVRQLHAEAERLPVGVTADVGHPGQRLEHLPVRPVWRVGARHPERADRHV